MSVQELVDLSAVLLQEEQFMHLTNYSINKHSDCFDANEDFDKGTKRTLKYFNGWLVRNGYNVSIMWAHIYVSILVCVPSRN